MRLFQIHCKYSKSAFPQTLSFRGNRSKEFFLEFFLRFHSFLSDFLKSSKSWFSISWIGLKFKPLKFVMDLKTLKLQTFGKFSKWLPWRNQLCKSPDPGNNCSWNMKTRNTVTEAIWWFLGIWAANLSQLIRHQVQVQVQEQTFTNYQFEAKLKVFCLMIALFASFPSTCWCLIWFWRWIEMFWRIVDQFWIILMILVKRRKLIKVTRCSNGASVGKINGVWTLQHSNQNFIMMSILPAILPHQILPINGNS